MVGTRFTLTRRLPVAITALAVAITSFAVTPAHAAATPRSLFTNTVKPSVTATASGRTANVGVRFSTATSGVITAVKFYRGPKQKKAYTASLWSSKGKRLAKTTFAKSSTVGWETATLSKPVSIKAKSVYYVSYLASGGHYPIAKGTFARTYTHDGITVPKKGGRFTYSSHSTRPKKTTTTNFLVDVVFVPNSTAITAAELKLAATKRVFFGHQSVGGYVLNDGVAALYAGAKLPGPARPTLSSHGEVISPTTGGVLADAYAGTNFEPDGKIDDFAAYLRGGVAGQVKVAVVKYCYVDIYDGVDVSARFGYYRTQMSRLEAEFPNVTFLYATNPLEAGNTGANVARLKFNKLIRAQYASTGRLWDIAAIESTRPDGTRVTGTYYGEAYEELYAGYSLDGGHPNSAGSKALASALLKLIAHA